MSANRETCVLCEEPRRWGFTSRVAGGWVCTPCYRRELAPRAPCAACGAVAPAQYRFYGRGDGPLLCERCYHARIHVGICAMCRHRRPIHARDGRGRPRCEACHRQLRVEACAACGECRP